MRLIVIFTLLVVSALACLPGSITLARLWTDFANLSYSHGFFVAAVSIWLIVRDRAAIDATAVRPSWSAFVVLIGCAFAWLVFWRAGIEALYLVLMPLIAGLAVYAALGRQIASRVAFPLLFLYTAFPLWEWLTPALQRLTVAAVSLLLKIFGIPASVEDTFVILPAGTFEIAGGCAGLHFFVVGIALAALLGELDRRTLVRRAALLAGMAGLAMVANWLRVFIIILAGYFRGMDHYLVHNHYLFGWAVFAVGVAVFLFLNRRFLPDSGENAIRIGGNGASCQAVPPLRVACVIGALAIVPFIMILVHMRSEGQQQRVLIELPQGVGSWKGSRARQDSTWRPIFKGAHGTAQLTYRDETANGDLEVFAAYYGVQSQDAELVGYGNSVLGATQHSIGKVRAVESPAGRFLETEVVDALGTRSLMWWTYEVAGRRFVEPLFSQIWYGFSSLASEQPSALLAIRGRCGEDCRQARLAVAGFASDMSGPLLASIRQPQTRVGLAQHTTDSDHPPPASLQRALDEMREGKYAAAEGTLVEARHSPTESFTSAQYAMLLATLVESRLAQGKIQGAQSAHGELAQVLPDAAPTRLLGARLLVARGQVIDGVSELRRLALAFPDYVPGRLVLGRALLAQGNLLQAEAQLRAVLQRVPRHPEASLLLEQIRLRSARPEEIDDPLILNNLAWRYFEEGDARAEALARRAYELAPKNPAVLDTYGWILAQKKKLDVAVPILADAARAAPDEIEIQYHWAAALADAGKGAEARPVLRRLLETKGDFPRRKDAEQLLRTLLP